jgi:hypothetical protein
MSEPDMAKAHLYRGREFFIGVCLVALALLGKALLKIASSSASISPTIEFYEIFGPGVIVWTFISGVLVVWLSLTKIGASDKAIRRLRWLTRLGIAASILGLSPIVLMLSYSALTGHMFSENGGLLAVALTFLLGIPGAACALIAALFGNRSRRLVGTKR